MNDEVVFCKRCHRKLKDEISKKTGYGKVCYSKIDFHNHNFLFDVEGVEANEQE